jgi:EF-hand domain pair/EF hand
MNTKLCALMFAIVSLVANHAASEPGRPRPRSSSDHSTADHPSSAADSALFVRLDDDADAALSESEISPEHFRLFARLVRRGDVDGDGALSPAEFLAALTPSRPEKPLEEKQSAELPQADAVRYLLLTMDADRDNNITPDEVPGALRPALDAMRQRIDRNGNDVLERFELSRGGPQLARIAARVVEREGIDVQRELRELDRELGAAARRFDEPRAPKEALGDPQMTRELFARLDADGDGQLGEKELAGQNERRLAALMRRADRNRDGQISEREFIAAAKRLAERMARD